MSLTFIDILKVFRKLKGRCVLCLSPALAGYWSCFSEAVSCRVETGSNLILT